MQIVVIGAANVDIIAKSKAKIKPGDSNPADIGLKAGGVARNIAAMLALRKVDVDLITAVGNDPFGNLLRESCAGIGINTDAWIIKTNASTGVSLASIENNGDLYAGFTATTAPETIRTAELTKHRNRIKEADLLILDLNLSEKILALAIELRNERPVMVDAVSVEKAPRAKCILDRIDILTLNRHEAEALTGITLDTKQRVKQAAYSLISSGVKRVFITMGMAGVCAVDDSNAIFVPALPIVAKNTEGAGDAFSTGIAMKFTKDLRSQAEAGVALAAEHIGRNS